MVNVIAVRNLVAIVVFVIVFFWASASAESSSSSRAICKVFKGNCTTALRVARCESRMNPQAVGSAGERGLFQIHPIHFSWARPGRLFEPYWNAKVAYRLSRGGTNWGHWTCQP